MQKLKTIAIAAVAVFGIGGAVIASNSTQNANVMNTAAADQPVNWQPITPSHKGCDDDSQRPCTGFRSSASAPVTILEYGNQNL